MMDQNRKYHGSSKPANLLYWALSAACICAAVAATSEFLDMLWNRHQGDQGLPWLLLFGIVLVLYGMVWAALSLVWARWKGVAFSHILKVDAITYLPAILLPLNRTIAARYLLPAALVGILALKALFWRTSRPQTTTLRQWGDRFLAITLIMVWLISSVTIANLFFADLPVLITHLQTDPAWRLRYKLVQIYGDAGGDYYDFMLFVRDNTPENAVILRPQHWRRAGSWPGWINGPLDELVLYPRRLVNGPLDLVAQDRALTHAVLIPGQADFAAIPASMRDQVKVHWLLPGLGLVYLREEGP